jgi:hypothetical protein
MGSDVAAETLALMPLESNGTDGTVLMRGGHQYFSCGNQQVIPGGVKIVGESPTVQRLPFLLMPPRIADYPVEVRKGTGTAASLRAGK